MASTDRNRDIGGSDSNGGQPEAIEQADPWQGDDHVALKIDATPEEFAAGKYSKSVEHEGIKWRLHAIYENGRNYVFLQANFNNKLCNTLSIILSYRIKYTMNSGTKGVEKTDRKITGGQIQLLIVPRYTGGYHPNFGDEKKLSVEADLKIHSVRKNN